MSEVDDFLADMLPRLVAAEKALHKGDAEPRMETWSHNEPVTLFGAFGIFRSGWDEVSKAHRFVASSFSNNEGWDFELVTAGASGDLAYTVGYESHRTAVGGGPVAQHRLRVTQVYRREGGAWKVVHRHGDELTEPAPAR
ncbi:MAG: nuclear transport factor 2 family protein [Chloroflexota bacterium]|nr:nuclear transport factor 2 family protein [Chloroflexota bacterium]